jgi:hypothetical protein
MTSWYDESEVLASTSKTLSLIDDKYTSPNPTTFDLAAHTMLTAAPTYPQLHRPRNPADYTALPPVYLDEAALDKELEDNLELYTTKALPPDWAQTYHYTIQDFDNEDQVKALLQYVFVLDALNFCFWPLRGYEYEHLAASLKQTLVNNPRAFDAENLMKITSEELTQYLQPPKDLPLITLPGETHPLANAEILPIPLLHSRTRLLRELGAVLHVKYDGLAYNVVKAADGSARSLVRIITSSFPGFRDSSQFAHDQIYFYKRVQILVGDLWGSMNGKGICNFSDLDFLTCFPDYRIPQLFRSIGVLKTTEEFGKVLDTDDGKMNVLPNSEEEILIRCWTVQTVELIKNKIRAKGVQIEAFQLDWLLWERGEKMMKLGQIVPHHRTLTTFY